jgi:hypothetical protein
MKHHKTVISLLLSGLLSASVNASATLSLQVIGQHQTGVFNQGAAEIVAYDSKTERVFKVNAIASTVDVLDISTPTNPTLISTINTTALGGVANSVAVSKGLVAVAVEASNKQANGVVGFYDAATLSLIGSVTVGALPDMVTFTPNGRYVLVANEGEPSNDYTVDPEGSVSIIDLKGGVANAVVRTAGFVHLNGTEAALRAKGIRIFGPNATASQDLEPEYIAVSGNSRTAWVSLQEANAIAVVDIKNAQVTEIQPLGTKDHSITVNALDASDKDGINIKTWPVKGMYMPDTVASYNFRGKAYIVSANEGDSRDYGGYSEEKRVKDLILDATVFPNASTLKLDANIGRLKTTKANGDTDNDGDVDEIYSFGARSFSIRDTKGNLIFDSGSDLETITSQLLPTYFNSSHDSNSSFDSRSDDKGPEPEGIALGSIKGRTYAFVGLERIGGIMVYDVTNPRKVSFVTYINNRNFTVAAQLPDTTVNPAAGDLGPEGLTFISARKSPNGKPLLVVGNEVSGTTTIYQINIE